MKEIQLRVESFEEYRVDDCKGVQEVNQHMQYNFQGLIPISKMKEYAALGASDQWFHVYVSDEQDESVWLCGVISGMEMDVEGQTCRMGLTLVSGSALMDLKPHIRTFQSEALEYGQLLDTCNSSYEKAAKIMTAGSGRQIGQLVVQYKETDWEFLKRLAGQNHTVLVADVQTKGSKYYFGLPRREIGIAADIQEYHTQFDGNEYREKKSQGLSVASHDFESYIWESRELYQLGDIGKIEGRELIVWKIETEMRGNELYHRYYVKPANGFQTSLQENGKISGASLFGTVTNVEDERVQVTLQEDENAEGTGNRWFSYATVYSSPDGTGWYCMPEKGDRIRLYFPTSRESDAYAASAYHEAGSSLRTDPSCKFWRNKQGKEVRLAKDRILVTNNDGTYMELSDEDGINIVSSGSVRIQAQGTMEVSSNDSLIELNAKNKVSIRQGTTELTVDKSGFNVKGSRVKL